MLSEAEMVYATPGLKGKVVEQSPGRIPLILIDVNAGKVHPPGVLEKYIHCCVVPQPLLVDRVIEKLRLLRLC